MSDCDGPTGICQLFRRLLPVRPENSLPGESKCLVYGEIHMSTPWLRESGSLGTLLMIYFGTTGSFKAYFEDREV